MIQGLSTSKSVSISVDKSVAKTVVKSVGKSVGEANVDSQWGKTGNRFSALARSRSVIPDF